jgi:hypothetical protein
VFLLQPLQPLQLGSGCPLGLQGHGCLYNHIAYFTQHRPKAHLSVHKPSVANGCLATLKHRCSQGSPSISITWGLLEM